MTDLKISLKKWRQLKGYTQDEISEKLDISKGTWQNWENNKTIPNAIQIRKVIDLFDINFNQIKWEKDKQKT